MQLFVAACAVFVCGCNSGSDGGGGGIEDRIDRVCMDAVRGTYPEQSNSLYILPWSVGETYTVGQGNCTNFSHRADINQQFAYDMLMPIGTRILASRAGVVIAIEQSFTDGTRVPGQENFVFVEHDDGSVARYIHLTTQGALVQLQDTVAQGDVIALSGDTGNSTEPHLHFDVLAGTACSSNPRACNSLPITFRNTRLHVDGLVEGQSYTADQF